MIIWKNVNTYPISLSPGSGCSLKIPAARPARWANTAAVWCEGEGAMVGTQAEDGEGARDVRRQGWSCVRARARERVPHTPVRSYARTHAHTHALCVCLYKYMFASAYVCTSANGQADHNTGWSWGLVEGQELAQVRSACPGVHRAHLETNCHHLEPLQIAKT